MGQVFFLSPGPLRGPAAHDSRVRNISGMNRPGRLLFPTTCVNRPERPLSCETFRRGRLVLLHGSTKGSSCPKVKQGEGVERSACASKVAFCCASCAVKRLRPCEGRCFENVPLKRHILDEIYNQEHLQKTPEKAVKLERRGSSDKDVHLLSRAALAEL